MAFFLYWIFGIGCIAHTFDHIISKMFGGLLCCECVSALSSRGFGLLSLECGVSKASMVLSSLDLSI